MSRIPFRKVHLLPFSSQVLGESGFLQPKNLTHQNIRRRLLSCQACHHKQVSWRPNIKLFRQLQYIQTAIHRRSCTSKSDQNKGEITTNEKPIAVVPPKESTDAKAGAAVTNPRVGIPYKPVANVDIDYNKAYYKNTFISETRAVADYLLKYSDLEGLRKTAMRSAYSDGNEPPEMWYLKSDVEHRAYEIWGSESALNRERMKAQAAMEEGERYRKGLSALIGHLKKTVKDQGKRDEENKIFGGIKERQMMLKGSARVVTFAIVSNCAVMILKFGAYLCTGSATMLSESVHSLADMLNQCFLAVGIMQSIRTPSPDHPYGWSHARYVYSLISGVGIFFLGAGVAVYHGVSGLFYPHALESLAIAYSVLGGSMLVEGATLMVALNQVNKSARESGVTLTEYIMRGRDPSAVAVLLEDSAAVAGILLAGACLGLTSYTGNAIFDAVGSIAIGGLLGVVAVFLIRRNADFLVGRSIHPDRLRPIIEVLESDIMIRSIHDVKATYMGVESVRFKAEINFDGREITKCLVNRLDMELLLQEVHKLKTERELEVFMLDHGEQIIDILGQQVDRIEKNIKKKDSDVRHVDLEIL